LAQKVTKSIKVATVKYVIRLATMQYCISCDWVSY